MKFEDRIEELVLQDAKDYYYKGLVSSVESKFWLKEISSMYKRDIEEASLMHMVLFPYAVEYVSKYVVDEQGSEEDLGYKLKGNIDATATQTYH
jgi:hypothetical protein